MRKAIFFVSLIVCLASATTLLIWTAKFKDPLLAQTTPTASENVIVLDFNNLHARVFTSIGVQTSTFQSFGHSDLKSFTFLRSRGRCCPYSAALQKCLPLLN
jgi:hypothetical protein